MKSGNSGKNVAGKQQFNEGDSRQQAAAAKDEALEALQSEQNNRSESEQEASADEQMPSIQELNEQLDRAKDEVLRLRAEMDNFRKRLQRDADQQIKYASLPLLRDLVGVLDNLQRAVEAAKHEQATLQSLLDGVEMVIQQFLDVLNRHGCYGIEATGADFDPNVHEAVAYQPSEKAEAGKVIQEVIPGYRLHDRVVRPSSVVVSAGPQEAGQHGEEEQKKQ